MAVALGTNAGFVTTLPSVDPAGNTAGDSDGWLFAQRCTSPSGVNVVDRIGYWQDQSTHDAYNWQCALYSNDAAPTPDEPNVAISPGIYTGISCGANVSGYQNATVSIPILASTLYWIGLGFPTIGGSIDLNYTYPESEMACWEADAGGSLDTTWGSAIEDATILYSVYARYAKVSAGPGAFVLAGTAANFKVGMPASPGTFVLAGTEAALKHSWKLSTGSGAFVLTGMEATLSRPLSAVLSGTALATINEGDIKAGGKTIIITLTNAQWVPE